MGTGLYQCGARKLTEGRENAMVFGKVKTGQAKRLLTQPLQINAGMDMSAKRVKAFAVIAFVVREDKAFYR